MVEVVLQELYTYVYRRNNTVAKIIATRPIIYLWLEAERRLNSRVAKR